MFRILAIIIGLTCAGCACAAGAGGDAKMNLVKPTPDQAAWHDMELEMFIHFGPATWQNSEYDTLATPLSEIDPAKLDTDQWARVAVSMGAKQIVFVAKHTGGFCWWQTDTTDYGARQIPWRGGKGDVIADLQKSCHKYGLKLGIYLSIQDDHWARANNKPHDRNAYGEAYNEIYRQQLTEVLTRYGRIDEVWFDGGVNIPIADIITKHAPHALLFGAPGGYHNRIRWVGNEEGYSDYPNWNTVGDEWMPAEVDTVNVSPHYWFWKTTPDRTLRSVDELMDCYYRSVGYGCVLLLNQTPDTSGLIPEADAKRAAEFGAEVKRRFATSIAETEGKGNILDLDLASPTTIDHIVTMEDITEGERVRECTIQGKVDGQWKELCHGTAIGHKKIDRIPLVKVASVRLICLKSSAEPIIRKLAVYNAGIPSR